MISNHSMPYTWHPICINYNLPCGHESIMWLLSIKLCNLQWKMRKKWSLLTLTRWKTMNNIWYTFQSNMKDPDAQFLNNKSHWSSYTKTINTMSAEFSGMLLWNAVMCVYVNKSFFMWVISRFFTSKLIDLKMTKLSHF